MTQNAAQRRAIYKDVRALGSLVEGMNRVCAMRGTHGKQVLKDEDILALSELTRLGLVALTKIETQLNNLNGE